MYRHRLQYIKKAYERGNKIPFIKEAQSKRLFCIEYTYSYMECEEAFRRDALWWAGKIVEFLTVRYCFLTKNEKKGSLAEYMCPIMPWHWLLETKTRLPDSFLNDMMTNEKTLAFVRKKVINFKSFTEYLVGYCRDNALVAALLKEKNLI